MTGRSPGIQIGRNRDRNDTIGGVGTELHVRQVKHRQVGAVRFDDDPGLRCNGRVVIHVGDVIGKSFGHQKTIALGFEAAGGRTQGAEIVFGKAGRIGGVIDDIGSDSGQVVFTPSGTVKFINHCPVFRAGRQAGDTKMIFSPSKHTFPAAADVRGRAKICIGGVLGAVRHRGGAGIARFDEHYPAGAVSVYPVNIQGRHTGAGHLQVGCLRCRFGTDHELIRIGNGDVAKIYIVDLVGGDIETKFSHVVKSGKIHAH